jgi:peptidyl-prolyl cis-trans isomerase SDCCAG10
VENPFEDIVPRITAAEKREQQKAKLEAKQEADKRDKRAKAKKWVYLSISLMARLIK